MAIFEDPLARVLRRMLRMGDAARIHQSIVSCFCQFGYCLTARRVSAVGVGVLVPSALTTGLLFPEHKRETVACLSLLLLLESREAVGWDDTAMTQIHLFCLFLPLALIYFIRLVTAT